MLPQIEKGQSSAVVSNRPSALKIGKPALQVAALRHLRHVFCPRRPASQSTRSSFKKFGQAGRVRPPVKRAVRELVLRELTGKSLDAWPRLTRILGPATTRFQSRRSPGTALPRIARGNAGSCGLAPA